MSFIAPGTANKLKKYDPLSAPLTSAAYSLFGKGLNPPPPPGPPNQNDAANAAQSTTDAMRMRRGMLANIYGGALNQTAVTGKTSLGT